MSFSEELLRPDFWHEPLDQISKATGLTISLYGADCELLSGPHTHLPLTEKLKSSGFWTSGHQGLVFDQKVVSSTLETQQKTYETSFRMFGVSTLPLTIDGECVGVFVIGWVPEHFVDPVTSDNIAKQSNVPPMEIWRLIRMQPPMSPEKIKLYADMLGTFAHLLAKQLRSQIIDRENSRVLKVINDSAAALTAAQTTKAICEVAVDAVRKLANVTSVKVSIFTPMGQLEEIESFDDSPRTTNDDGGFLVIREQRVKIPIQSASKVVLGTIEVIKLNNDAENEFSPELNALASQVAVALQKARLIADLERERSAFRTANSELTKMHRMKDEFLATVSHELRTPLNSILGWSQLLSQGMLETDEFGNAIDAIERNAKIQSLLVEDLLDVSRVISGKMKLQLEVLDVMPILKNAIETVSPGSEGKSQKLHLSLPEKSVFLKGDPTRLQQVFWNILSNAVKFTPTNGQISVIVSDLGPYLKIEISDTGKGINPKFIPHLFDRFSQADGSLTRAFGGLGLGLAIVRHLVELHGGTVSAESEGEGRGSRFTILLPQNVTDFELDTARDVVRELDSGVGQGRRELEGLKILVIDDEADSLRLIKFVLEKSGASVNAASTARAAYDELLTWRPDLIVSDISMPDESGFDFIRRVRELSRPEGGATPAFALTANAGDEASKKALDAGFQKYFTKPLDPKALLGCLKEFALVH